MCAIVSSLGAMFFSGAGVVRVCVRPSFRIFEMKVAQNGDNKSVWQVIVSVVLSQRVCARAGGKMSLLFVWWCERVRGGGLDPKKRKENCAARLGCVRVFHVLVDVFLSLLLPPALVPACDATARNHEGFNTLLIDFRLRICSTNRTLPLTKWWAQSKIVGRSP